MRRREWRDRVAGCKNTHREAETKLRRPNKKGSLSGCLRSVEKQPLCWRWMSRMQPRYPRRPGLQHLLHATVAAGRHLDGREFLAFDDHLDFVGIEDLALQQSCRHTMHDVLVPRQNLYRRLITGIDQHSNFFVDQLRGLFAEVA